MPRATLAFALASHSIKTLPFNWYFNYNYTIVVVALFGGVVVVRAQLPLQRLHADWPLEMFDNLTHNLMLHATSNLN